MTDQEAVSQLIDVLQSLRNVDGKGSGGYEQAWGNGTVHRFVALQQSRSTSYAELY